METRLENDPAFPGSDRRMRPMPTRALVPLLASLALVRLLALAAPSAAQETWTATSTTNAPTGRYLQTSVWTGSKMVVWGGVAASTTLDTGGVYDLAADAWTATSMTDAPTDRCEHTAVWTGSRMIVWGGTRQTASGHLYLNTGAAYDPRTDTWTPISMTNAPGVRTGHRAVWTGSRMIVWGGRVGYEGLNSGGVYDPANDTWKPMSTTNAPTARYAHTAVWTGSGMIVWGGYTASPSEGNTGGLYDPVTDTWTATSMTNAPRGRDQHSAVWTGSKMVVWGGSGDLGWLDDGGLYDPATDTWTATSTMNAPYARYAHTAVWTGSRMLVWGGDGLGTGFMDSGSVYNPTTDTWTWMDAADAPAGRYLHAAAWTGSRMIVWGGYGGVFQLEDVLNTGGVYSNPAVVPPLPAAADFYTLTPCRLVDTRIGAGPLGGPALVAGAIRSFPVTGGRCSIPPTATAVSVNVTAVGASAPGHLTLYSGDAATPPPTSTISFSPVEARASNAIVLLATNGSAINVRNGSAGGVHLVLDVNGYFQ